MQTVRGSRILVLMGTAIGIVAAGAWLAEAGDDAKPTSGAQPAPKKAGLRKTLLADGADADSAEIREIAKAYRQLQQAVRKRDAAAEAAKPVKLPDRPKKTVTAPALDSKQIDAMIDKTFTEAKVTPARMTTDEEFIRRAYLDITGTLPEPGDILAFCREKDRSKRAKLIDTLLQSPGYALNWARYWRDVIEFHSSNQNMNQVRYDTFEEWMSQELAKNEPWDEIATKIITSTGRNDELGAVNFALAQSSGAPVEMAGEVSRIFLGIQIQCAQCHDHPNDSWKRNQFHEFAAFFAGARVQRRVAGAMNPKQEQELRKELQAAKGAAKADLAAKLRPHFVLEDQKGKVRYAMPDLKDPTKNSPVAPKFFLASSAEPIPVDLPVRERRTLIASYVTGQDNPWFARAFVNRVWCVLMGEGFYSPVDDLGPGRKANASEVIDTLADEWAKGGYDIRWLFRVILNTHVYQREIRSVNSAAGRTPFASNCAGRLRADQIYDAIAHALDEPFDANKLPARFARALAQVGGDKKGMRGPFSPRNLLHKLFGVDPSTPTDDIMGTIPQALFLMNGPQLNNAISARPNTMLGKLLMSTPDNRAVLNMLYLRALARTPSASEVETCGEYIMSVGDRKAAFEDILWALINSTEFVSRR